MIYFIKEYDSNNIKIGYTKNMASLYKRLSRFKTANPRKFKILRVIEGSLQNEASLHKMFADYNISGEWFEMNELLIANIGKALNFEMIKDINVFRGYTSKNNTQQELIIAQNILSILQDVNGYVTFSNFVKYFNRSESASTVYWKALKDRFNVVDMSNKGLEFGRDLRSAKRKEQIFNTTKLIESKITLKVPIILEKLSKELDVGRNAVRGYLKDNKGKIDKYHQKEFLSMAYKTVQSRYQLDLKLKKVKEIDLNLSELARKIEVHFNTINKHKEYIRYKFPHILK